MLRLIERKGEGFVKFAEGDVELSDNSFWGIAVLQCSRREVFDEFVARTLSSNIAVAAVEQAIHCLQMNKPPSHRVGDLRMLQDVYTKLTGRHFDSAATPMPIEGIEKSAGTMDLEAARKIYGEIDPDSLDGLFLGFPGQKIRIVRKDELETADFHPASLADQSPDAPPPDPGFDDIRQELIDSSLPQTAAEEKETP